MIKPQEGFQTEFLSSSADIVIGGGAAGVGKTFAELLEPIYHKDVPGFNAMFFRRTSVQIRNPGGLWDKSMELYTKLGGKSREQQLDWSFPKGSTVKFSHLEHLKNIYDHQGAEYCLIVFDELTHFEKQMFFYLITRNRSTCGVKPYVRATCNPDPDSWVADFIKWWINQDTGFPIPDRIGKIRYLVVDGDKYIWGDTKDEVFQKSKHIIEKAISKYKGAVTIDDFIKSVTFISGSIYDNQELLKVNPSYLANLLSQDEPTRKALLDGNWKQSLSNIDLYNYPAFINMFCDEKMLPRGERRKYITADIALEGSNKLVVGYWEDFDLMDIEIMPKSDGPEVVKLIQSVAEYYEVPSSNICFDADGVGGFVEGYIPGSVPFHGGSAALEVYDPNSGQMIKENYINLKAQCYYRSAKRVLKGEYRISSHVWEKRYDNEMTVRERFLKERKVIKKDKVDSDGKMRLMKKEEMKQLLGGESPDLMDMFSIRESLELILPIEFTDADYSQ